MAHLLSLFLLFPFIQKAAVEETTVDFLRQLDIRSEEHEVVTRDGYILKVFRIPRPGGIPVILVHGFMCTSDVWVLMRREHNLATILADSNYDVWITNQRGNTYSHKHIRLSSDPTNYRFWNFSIHEIGTQDLPAILDHVRDVTGYEKLLYLGHSLGTTAFLIMCSERPEYCSRFESAVLLAPVAFPPQNIRQPTVGLIIKWAKQIAQNLRRMRTYEFLGRNHSFVNSFLTVCSKSSNLFCQVLLKYVFNLDRERQAAFTKPLNYYLSSSLGGTSLKLFEHISSMISPNGRFAPYEYTSRQLRHFDTLRPLSRNYNIGNITIPIALYYGADDIFIDEKSMNTLRSKLKNVVLDKSVPAPFLHLGFMYNLKDHYDIVEDVLSFFHQSSKLDQ